MSYGGSTGVVAGGGDGGFGRGVGYLPSLSIINYVGMSKDMGKLPQRY